MTFQIPIVSLSSQIPVTLIPVEAPNFRRAKRTAEYRLKQKGITDAKALGHSAHEAALLYRELVVRPMYNLGDLNGPRNNDWKNHERTPLYDER